MAVFIRRPSAPSSMAWAASLCGAYAGVYDHGDLRDAFAEDAEVGGILDGLGRSL